MKYVWYGTIKNVKEQETIVKGYKDKDDKTQHILASEGWFVQVGNFSFYVGDEEPIGYRSGDTVKLTMENMGKLT